MKAMILAAGKGTRLRPFTDTMPKALFPINNISLLELLIRKMIHFGINEIIINTHHFADKIEEFLIEKKNFNIRIEISNEEKLLETGGGLKKAQSFFDDGMDFLLHNVDILSPINFNDLQRFHAASGNIATLAVSERETSRYFLFDDEDKLKGWENLKSGEKKLFFDLPLKSFAFSGIHILSPAIFGHFPEKDVFSLTDLYLDLCSKSNIGAYVHDAEGWFDVGKIEDIDRIKSQFINYM